jgi:hypothetical protein
MIRAKCGLEENWRLLVIIATVCSVDREVVEDNSVSIVKPKGVGE